MSSGKLSWLQIRRARPITCSMRTMCQYGSTKCTYLVFLRLIPSAPEAVIMNTLMISPYWLFGARSRNLAASAVGNWSQAPL